MGDGEPHDVRQFQVGDGRCFCRAAGDGGGRRGTAENTRKHRGTVGDGGGLPR